MKNENILIPSKTYFSNAYKLLFSPNINLSKKRYDYYHIFRKIYTNPDFKNLVRNNFSREIIKLSAGTSDRMSFKPYLQEIGNNLQTNGYYRNYNPPKGNIEARKALALMESLKFGNKKVYTPNDISLATGTTGAITMIFEYIKRNFPDEEILISVPTYYLYKFTAKYFCLKFKEITSLRSVNFESPLFVSINEIIKNITKKTKLIVLVQPNNPTGEIYPEKDLKKLLELAKKKNILILIDELFFELIFNRPEVKNTDVIAKEVRALKNIVITKGYSKTRNLPGLRIGYLFSKNRALMNAVEEISEQRQCFPGASNFVGLICLDSFIQTARFLVKNNVSIPVKFIIKDLKNKFKFSDTIQKKTVKELVKLYFGYKKYANQMLSFYNKNYDIALEILKENLITYMPKASGFNTFFKISCLEKVNFFDFCFNFYLVCGIQTQIGPCFAYDQKMWEENPKLGFWLRITFARERNELVQGLKQFIEFKKLYLNNKEKFLKTGLEF